MGVIPLQFKEGEGWQMLGLIGDEKVTIRGLSGKLRPRQMLEAEIARRLGPPTRISLQSRIDTVDELEYFRNGGDSPLHAEEPGAGGLKEATGRGDGNPCSSPLPIAYSSRLNSLQREWQVIARLWHKQRHDE